LYKICADFYKSVFNMAIYTSRDHRGLNERRFKQNILISDLAVNLSIVLNGQNTIKMKKKKLELKLIY
jgi:hypothetical protein